MDSVIAPTGCLLLRVRKFRLRKKKRVYRFELVQMRRKKREQQDRPDISPELPETAGLIYHPKREKIGKNLTAASRHRIRNVATFFRWMRYSNRKSSDIMRYGRNSTFGVSIVNACSTFFSVSLRDCWPST